jgi:hypothetical protein
MMMLDAAAVLVMVMLATSGPGGTWRWELPDAQLLLAGQQGDSEHMPVAIGEMRAARDWWWVLSISDHLLTTLRAECKEAVHTLYLSMCISAAAAGVHHHHHHHQLLLLLLLHQQPPHLKLCSGVVVVRPSQ